MAGGRILVVDDDNVLRASIARILEEEGYSVANAADGAAALDIVADDPPDAILLDVMMPGMNGKEFLQQLRRTNGSDIPVVVMTALQGIASDRLVELGANDMVEKPFDVDELLNKVALALFRSGEYETLMERPAVPRDSEVPREPEPAPGRAGGTVLMLDQDHELMARMDRLLADRGHTLVTLTRPGADLTRLAIALEPIALFLELDGPVDGLALLRELRASHALRDVPIMMCAGSAAAANRHRAEIEALRAEVAIKPRDIERAIAFVERAARDRVESRVL